MGLDVDAFARMHKRQGYETYEDGEDFEARGWYWVHQGDSSSQLFEGLVPGWHVPSEDHVREHDRFSFRAGTYSGYARWLHSLRQKAWPGLELLATHDGCDGCIGPVACRQLAAAFNTHAEKAAAAGSWFYAVYRNFQRAFTTGAEGFVCFL